MGQDWTDLLFSHRVLGIEIGIEIVVVIDFWQFSDFDSDFDFDACRPNLTCGVGKKRRGDIKIPPVF